MLERRVKKEAGKLTCSLLLWALTTPDFQKIQQNRVHTTHQHIETAFYNFLEIILKICFEAHLISFNL